MKVAMLSSLSEKGTFNGPVHHGERAVKLFDLIAHDTKGLRVATHGLPASELDFFGTWNTLIVISIGSHHFHSSIFEMIETSLRHH